MRAGGPRSQVWAGATDDSSRLYTWPMRAGGPRSQVWVGATDDSSRLYTWPMRAGGPRFQVWVGATNERSQLCPAHAGRRPALLASTWIGDRCN